MVYERFKREVIKEDLLRQGDVAICGLSGGADSVALLFLLLRLSGEMRFSLRAVHVHHGIRGEEADRDERFVEELCGRLDVPLEVFRVDVPSYSQKKGLGIEEAGRILRREAFEKVREEFPPGRGKICLAHHMEDQAETVIHHLCRGSGLRGLSGIWPRQEGYVHPLLSFHKAQLMDYLRDLGEDFVTDSTNLEQEVTRNRIRAKVLPLLEEEVHQGSVEHLCSAARIVRQADEYLTRESERKLESLLLPAPSGREGILLSGEAMKEEEILKAYLVKGCIARLGKQRDLSQVHVEGCLSLFLRPPGKRLSLGGGVVCERIGEGLFFYRQGPLAPGEQGGTFREIQVTPPRMGEAFFLETPWGRATLLLRPYLGEEIVEKKYTKWFDYDKIQPDICIRTRREGDFLSLGPQGKKLLRRFLIDAKIPQNLRDQVPLLCCGQQVLWVIPYRMGEGARLDSQTKTLLEVSWLDGGYIDE